jgi:hypothetical protein
MISKNLGSMPI